MNKEALRKILETSEEIYESKRDNSYEIVDKYFIKKLREKLDMTQVVFASAFGVNIKTVEKWEQGSNVPRPIVKKFLYIIDKNPHLVQQIYTFQKKVLKEEYKQIYIHINPRSNIKIQDSIVKNYEKMVDHTINEFSPMQLVPNDTENLVKGMLTS